jgi:hypothetical protein
MNSPTSIPDHDLFAKSKDRGHPRLVGRRLITVRKDSRSDLFQRLEGWWVNLVIQTLTGRRTEPIKVQELHDRLAVLAGDDKIDSLPIEFNDKLPEGTIDATGDKRRFVEQLRALNLSTERIALPCSAPWRLFEIRLGAAQAICPQSTCASADCGLL